jgi:hypothetical protein
VDIGCASELHLLKLTQFVKEMGVHAWKPPRVRSPDYCSYRV